MFGLLKENGPFLVKARTLPDKDTYLEKNKYGWNRAAHTLYIDSPVGTGFSFADKLHSNDTNVSIDLANVIFQFLKLFPAYIGKANATLQRPPKVYLFGESYGGTVVTDLAKYISSVENLNDVLDLVGIGIGNGFISPRYQSTMYSDFLTSLALIDSKKSELLKFIEERLIITIENEQLLDAYVLWQQELKEITDTLGIANFYNMAHNNPDITERNFWQFLQQPRVRKALHIGQRPFSDGELVSKNWMVVQIIPSTI